MGDSAAVKIKRASKHIDELNELLREKRPFTYAVETNTQTGERSTFAKKNKAVIDECVAISADAVHNLRSALDHAYWDIVSPFAASEREQRAVQFPFSETSARLEEAIKNRLAHRVSDRFLKALLGLKPYGEAGGNELLYLLHEVDLIDKHKVLPPVGDYTKLSSDMIRRQLPDFPAYIHMGGGHFAQNRRDIGWRVPVTSLATMDLGLPVPPTTFMFHKELDIPVDIIVSVGSSRTLRPMIPTLNKLVDITKKTVIIIRAAAK